ncbi:MAG: ATP synthase F1 subunit delta [Bacteroidetes bacterium]|jgi:F-type H+-transporting ATPase subunit delta|nr:ATP synthase F1 subunit delta [Bacteroidota bacterium]
MPNPRLAHRYAKSLIDLSTEKNQLELAYADMKFLQSICKSNKDFVNVLQSPIIMPSTKIKILEAVVSSSISDISNLFLKLLVSKGREFELPEIVTAFIDQYNSIKGIHQVKLTTAIALSEELKQAIATKAAKDGGLGKVELEAKVDESLIGGFVLEYNNNLVDASIARDLRDIKKQFAKNVYVPALR